MRWGRRAPADTSSGPANSAGTQPPTLGRRLVVAVCSAAGSPGATTLGMVLALAWPGDDCLLVELDPSGGDLAFRLNARGRRELFLDREPTVLTLAASAHAGGTADLGAVAQSTTLGLRVVAGARMPEDWTPMRALWPLIGERIAAWPGSVIVDLGRIQPDHPVMGVAEVADLILVLTRPTLEGLHHAGHRVKALSAALNGSGDGPRIAIVARAGLHDKDAVDQVSAMLRRLDQPASAMGGFADDPHGVDLLLSGRDSQELRASALLRSGAALAARIQRASVLPIPAGPASADHGATGVRRLRGA